MYTIIKNGAQLSIEDNLVPVKLNRSNIYIPCELIEAEGIVINNSYVEPIEDLEIHWLDGANRIDTLNTAGAEAMQNLGKEPPVSAGFFTYGEWQPNTKYKQYALFTYNGNPYFAKQEHTSLAVYPPDAKGVESLYGARPSPDLDGIYPYVYNMAVELGMKVRSAKDGNVYECYANATDTLLNDPADVPAIFVKL